MMLRATLAALVGVVMGWAAQATMAGEAPQGGTADIVKEIVTGGTWKPLWDGKTLNGWHVIGKGQWTIEDGAIIGRKGTEPDFGHLVTDASYGDFVVRVKYKAVKGNSGVYFRIEEKGYSGVTGFQAEIDPTKDAGGLYETNGRAWVVQPKPEDVKKWYRPGEWNEMTVAALGRHLVVYVNGMKSAEVLDDPGRAEGRIALQLHGGMDMEVRFKDLEIITFDNLMASGDLSSWRQPTGQWQMVGEAGVDPAKPKEIVTKEGKGTIVNGPAGRTSNLFSKAEHGDVAAHIEFMIPKGSNSGIYFQSRYELQVYDSYGVAKDQYPGIECGGIYPRWINNHEVGGHTPLVNASRPGGQWQSFEVVYRAPRFDQSGKKIANATFVKVIHNGKLIHENIEVMGPTRAAAFEDEKALGPLMFQGDHGPVAYRNVTITPLGKNAAK